MNFSKKLVEVRTTRLKSPSTHRKYKFHLLGICLVITLLVLCLIWGIRTGRHTIQNIFNETPDIESMEVLPQGYTTTLKDCEGETIQLLTDKDTSRIYVSIDKIPSNLQNAFIAIEDERFFEHNGIDLYDSSDGTITQQLLKNQLFTENNDVSYAGRLKKNLQQLYLSIRFEQTYDKKQILEYYLNTINLGQNILGVQAAAKYYFGKDVSSLTLSECAVLAGIEKNPSSYSPVTHPKHNRLQRTAVLTCMKEQGYITNEDYTQAINDDVYSRIQSIAAGKSSIQSETSTSSFSNAVINQVISDLKSKLGYTETQAYNTLYSRGLTIYTTQDSSMQQICDRIINHSKLNKKTKMQHSFVLIDQSTGEVKALCGEDAAELTRQPGSAFQVLSAYLPALDTAGMTLATVQDDSEYCYPGTKKKVTNRYGLSYRGLSTIHTAITDSINVIAVKTLEQTGVKTSYDYLLNLGFTSVVDKYTDNSGNSYTDIDFPLAEGTLTKGVSNLEMTGAYASIANGGIYHQPVFYTKILDHDGNVLIDNSDTSSSGTRVMKDSTAWLLTSALTTTANTETGTSVKSRHSNMELAGKSGISSDNADLWFVGYTPYLTAGIWCGYEDSSAIKDSYRKYHEEIWRNIMENINKKFNDKEFKKPSSVTTAVICTKCGKLAITGLCSKAIGGSCEKTEYFASDTVPTETCDCHVKCRICKSSGHLAGDNCPESKIYTAVYLQKNELSAENTESSDKVAKTDDSPLIIPSYLSHSQCEVHN